MSASPHHYKKSDQDEYVRQLLVLFPRGDPDYFRNCLEYYSENPVERIAEKILVDLGGQYPQIPVPQQQHDNRLNACLRILALEIFPDCDIGFLRDQVLQCRYAHIESVVDAMLTMHGKWPERLNYGKMDPAEGIRSEKYKRQAQLQLMKDYPQVWKSSIRAVLAENNWDYIHSYDQLKEMGSGGFWSTLRNFFLHWSAASNVAAQQGHISDYHLLEQLKQLNQRATDVQIRDDRHLAQKINMIEYADNHQLMTCDCCYGDYTFEQLSFCTEGDHAFCHDCINHYMSEGLFGQGALRGQSRIQCISSTDDCGGCLSTQMLQRVVTEDVWRAYENALLEDCCQHQEQRIQCCACSYFELDESTKPLQSTLLYANRAIQYIAQWTMVVELLVFSFVLYKQDNQFLLFSTFVFLLSFQWISFQQWDVMNDLEIAYARVARSRRGVSFRCQNLACRTVTCLECHQPMRGPHKCWEKETDGLRLYVEKAMADAVKRTCPNCSLSFQKSDGCNKIVCRCGYTMCYVCRKDIGKESYSHFCQHFRDRPGTKCNQCNKCDLYKTDPEDELVQRASARARNQYLQAHPQAANQTNNIRIGPKTTIDKMEEYKQACVLWCLEKGLELIV
ncbi:hypothetical protein MBANPS3_002638 [Mucor bainieri]